MSTTAAEIATLEYTSVKVPYEILNKKFRHAQKIIDRDISHLQSAINEISKLSPDLQRPAMEALWERLKSFRQKYADCLDKEGGYADRCKKRLEHLKEYDSEQEVVVSLWKRQRLDRMLADHFLRSTFYDTAIKLVKSSKIEGLVDTDVFLAGREIESSLRGHKTKMCLQWCHDNRSRLKKTKSTLEFNLHVQEFVELIRAGKYMDAIKYAQKNLVEGEGMSKEKLQETMALLAFKPNTECTKYKALFSLNRWEELVEEFRRNNFDLHHLQSESMLSTVLQAGLSVIKTHQCYSVNERSPDCPVCNEPLNKLATSLPHSHCTQSRLICFISGEVMNEHNPPLMLPNGNVYGERALAQMSESTGVVTCPRTKETFWFQEAQKVFVM